MSRYDRDGGDRYSSRDDRGGSDRYSSRDYRAGGDRYSSRDDRGGNDRYSSRDDRGGSDRYGSREYRGGGGGDRYRDREYRGGGGDRYREREYRGGGGDRYRDRRVDDECVIFVGNISSRTREEDLRHAFDKYGRVYSVTLKDSFAFVEMEDYRDAKDAVRGLRDYKLDGRYWNVEPRGIRKRHKERRVSAAVSRGEFAVVIENIPNSTSWQDLKDFARDNAGCEPAFSEVFNADGDVKSGRIEYSAEEDARKAVDKLDGMNFTRSELVVKVYMDV